MLHSLMLGFLICVFVYGYIVSHHTNAGKISFLRMEDSLQSLKTGDMIFTKSRNWTSRVQQYFFGSFINHCAMVFRSLDGNLWIWDLAPQVGAYMTPLKEFVRNNWRARPPNPQSPPIGMKISYVVPRASERFSANDIQTKSALYVRRLYKPLDQARVLEFIQKNIGRPYSWRFWLSAYARVTGLQFPLGWHIATDPLGMFCSELVAHTFVHAGALDPVRSAPPSILPVHFWENDLSWIQGYGLHPPEQLIGSPPDVTMSEQLEKWEDGISTSPHVIDTLVDLVHRSM